MVIGTAGALPKPPSTPVQFLEGIGSLYVYYPDEADFLLDMDERELASVVRAWLISPKPISIQG
jgi:hypothetical protein